MSRSDSDTDRKLDNPLEHLLGYQIRRASASIMSELSNRFSDLGLTVTEASILQLIERNPDIIQSAIGTALGIKRANSAPLIASLSDKALIERSRADGRSQHLRLTDKGKETVAFILECVHSQEDTLGDGLSAGEKARIIALLSRIWK